MAVTKQELRDKIEQLEDHKGSHTEFISVYIPAGYDANSVQKQLEAEKSTAKNIKSTSTRKNVTDALEKIIRFLKGLGRTPENGIAIFCGNVSQIDSQDDLQLWDIEPPMPLKVRMYRCDKDFVLDPLKEMLEVTEVFGLLVMDRKEATIGLLEGKRIEVLQKMTSGVPSKVRAGGQSSQRFHRITEGLTKEFYKRIADEMKTIFFDMPKLKGILIGGPIPTKDEFIDQEYLPTKLRERVISRQDLGYADEHGLKLLVEASKEVLSTQEITKEKKLLNGFFEILGGKPGFALFKEDEVRNALQYGAVDTLILSEGLTKSLLKELRNMAEDMGSKVEIVSLETTEGDQFFKLSGMGALLRYRL